MKLIADWLHSHWRRGREFVVHHILHADDPPHRLALGVAIAMFITFTPTIGFQMALVFALCWLLGGNKLVGLPLVWISNPATIVPIYYPCLWLGEHLMGKPPRDLGWFQGFADAPTDWMPKVRFFGSRFWEVAVELWVGCLVVGGVLGVGAYYATYWGVYGYRMRKWGQLVPPPIESLTAIDGEGSSGPQALIPAERPASERQHEES
jgi:uncharacterized protein (DUF2062 family)